MTSKNRETLFMFISLITIVGFILITKSFIPITYAVNDDTTMKSIASGIMTGTPDGHLIFIKYVVGSVIAFLYKIYNGVDWYGCVMLSIILVSIATFLYRAKSLFKNNLLYGLIVVLSLFTIVIFENFVNFQFTVVSAIAAAAAIFFYNTIDITKENYWREYIIVLLLAWISYSVRSTTFIMALPFAGLSFLFKNCKWKEKIVVCLILILGLFAITYVESKAYSSDEWQFYQEYNNHRSIVYDYFDVPGYEENKELYLLLEMDENDVYNLGEYNLSLIDGIEHKIQKIGEYAEQQWEENTSLTTRILEALRIIKKAYLKNRSILLNVLAKIVILSNICYEFKNRKKYIWLNIFFLGVEAVLAFYLGYQGRMVTRVMTSLFLIEFFSALSIWYEDHKLTLVRNIKGTKSKIVIIALICLSVFMIFEIQENQNDKFQKNLEYEELKSFYKKNSDNVYFVNAYDIWFYTDNFKIFEEYQLKNYSKLGEWSTFSPVENEEMQRYGIKEVDSALIERDNVYLIYKEPNEFVTSRYLEDYTTVDWIQVDEVLIDKNAVPVYKLHGMK